MNLVMITTARRIEILRQSLSSLVNNASDWTKHTLTVVLDGYGEYEFEEAKYNALNSTTIVNYRSIGASRSRNIGASSIPRYLRQSHVMFVDDDVYACPGWDEQLENVTTTWPTAIVSGHAHPYNHTVVSESKNYITTNVISTVHMCMPWKLWGKIGYFAEPGGPGGSEDVDYCRRSVDMGHPLVITKPHCIIHTGITSSSGKPIVGAEMVMERNRELERLYGLEGRILYT